MLLLQNVIEAYRGGGGGKDWRFCLLAGSVLSDIAMNNINRGNRDYTMNDTLANH